MAGFLQTMFARHRRSLSAKLFTLVVTCVLVAEAVVLMPSIAYHRVAFLQDRIEAAFLISLAYESPYGEIIDEAVADELFATAGIKGASALRDGKQSMVMAPDIYVDPAEGVPLPVMHYVDLHDGWSPATLAAPWATLLSTDDHLVSATGMARFAGQGSVTVLVSEAAMRKDLWTYFRNVLLLSLVISSLTASFVYARLARMIVEPVKALSRNMMAFEVDPESPANVLVPSRRVDELGVAEKSLAALESRTQALLSERRRLAALGAGISKISHDLRNVLASAQLMSDRLAKSDDPRVAKLSPRLVASLDRAVALSRDTLSFARMSPRVLQLHATSIRTLIDDVFDDAAHLGVAFVNAAPDDLVAVVDRTQLYRAVFNLVKNAAEAIDPAPTMPIDDIAVATKGKVVVSATVTGSELQLRVADDGPGIPASARAELFEPFAGSQKPGGSGLGVAIAAEIAKAHHGRLDLETSDASGTVFCMTLPLQDGSGTLSTPGNSDGDGQIRRNQDAGSSTA